MTYSDISVTNASTFTAAAIFGFTGVYNVFLFFYTRPGLLLFTRPVEPDLEAPPVLRGDTTAGEGLAIPTEGGADQGQTRREQDPPETNEQSGPAPASGLPQV
jgi:hypothetical protein